MTAHIDSSRWTGRRSRAFPHPLAVLYWIVTGLQKHLCPHVWSLRYDSCKLCGLTHAQRMDHSWRGPWRNALIRDRIYWEIEL